MTAFIDRYLARHPELATAQPVRLGRGSYHARMPDGQIEAHCFGTPIHFQAPDGLWHPIDTTLIDHGDYFAPIGVSIRIEKRTGTLVNIGGRWTQRMISTGIFRPDTGHFAAMWNVPLGAPVDNILLARGNGIEHHLEILADGVRERLVLLAAPALKAGDWFGFKTEISDDFVRGEIGEFNRDGYHFLAPAAWDAHGHRLPCQRFADRILGRQYLFTVVPAANLLAAAYPVTIDPDYTGSTADGHIYGSSASYSTARSTSFQISTSATTLSVGQWFSSPLYSVFRGFLKFDTSGVPDAATIAQVNLKLYLDTDTSDTDFDVQIVKQDWSASDPITSSNKETPYDGCLSGTADSNIWRNTSGMSNGTQYTSGNLGTTWPSKTGNTYYSLRSSRDANNNTPTGNEYITIRSADHATDKPILTIAYSEGSITPHLNLYRQFRI